MKRKSKKLMKKKYIRFSNAKKSLVKNRRKLYSKKLVSRRHFLNKKLGSRKYKRRYRIKQRRKIRNKHSRKRNINMSGGGIPFGGTIKGLLGLTHDDEKSRENMIGNLCALNSVRPTTDSQLSGILNNVCSLDESVKKEKKGNGIVKGAMRLIGNMATLPLRTATGVVKNVTGFDATEAAYNAIKSSVSKDESKQIQPLLPQAQKSLTGGQPLQINHNVQQPQIQTGINYSQGQMQGGNKNNFQPNVFTPSPINDVTRLKNIEYKLASGGSLTNEEIQYVSSLN